MFIVKLHSFPPKFSWEHCNPHVSRFLRDMGCLQYPESNPDLMLPDSHPYTISVARQSKFRCDESVRFSFARILSDRAWTLAGMTNSSHHAPSGTGRVCIP